jgi:hypothetical protein
MGLFRHPHLTRGIVHTPEGAFRIERGVADLPDDTGEALGWVRLQQDTPPAVTVPSAEGETLAGGSATTSGGRRPARPRPAPTRKLAGVNGALDEVLSAVDAAVRGRQRVEVPAQGIDVAFDAGVVAICRTCDISWEVTRRQFSNLAWWSCPRGCRPAADLQH